MTCGVLHLFYYDRAGELSRSMCAPARRTSITRVGEIALARIDVLQYCIIHAYRYVCTVCRVWASITYTCYIHNIIARHNIGTQRIHELDMCVCVCVCVRCR